MPQGKLTKRFLDSTRGRIVVLLRGAQSTVSDLAGTLELTDNAVRSHLAILERDGLVRQAGLRKGARKPHFAYELTPEAEELFPKAYDALLSRFIAVLKSRLSAKMFRETLREVGRTLFEHGPTGSPRQKPEERIQGALKLLEALGGSARVEKVGDQLIIRSQSCPLASVVAEHPETCEIVEALISEATGARVRQACSTDGPPRCEFHVVPEK